MRRVETPDEAKAILLEIGAPERLVRHAFLVLEAAEELLRAMRALGVAVDERLVRAGAMLHDAGKSKHTAELKEPGNKHEEAGEALLLQRDIDPSIARICVTHAQWATHECSLEELLVALADSLWKGARREPLEQRVVAAVAERLSRDRWLVFVELDTCFEKIADGASDRLRRSELGVT